MWFAVQPRHALLLRHIGLVTSDQAPTCVPPVHATAALFVLDPLNRMGGPWLHTI